MYKNHNLSHFTHCCDDLTNQTTIYIWYVYFRNSIRSHNEKNKLQTYFNLQPCDAKYLHLKLEIILLKCFTVNIKIRTHMLF